MAKRLLQKNMNSNIMCSQNSAGHNDISNNGFSSRSGNSEIAAMTVLVHRFDLYEGGPNAKKSEKQQVEEDNGDDLDSFFDPPPSFFSLP